MHVVRHADEPPCLLRADRRPSSGRGPGEEVAGDLPARTAQQVLHLDDLSVGLRQGARRLRDAPPQGRGRVSLRGLVGLRLGGKLLSAESLGRPERGRGSATDAGAGAAHEPREPGQLRLDRCTGEHPLPGAEKHRLKRILDSRLIQPAGAERLPHLGTGRFMPAGKRRGVSGSRPVESI